jgi:hypothetical protein
VITRAMIRKCFGPHVTIRRKFFGGFRVTTPTGGEVEIDHHKCKIHAGGSDVYEAVTLLTADAWGDITAEGSAEFNMAMIAHGEALGVNVTPSVPTGCGCLNVLAAAIIFLFVLAITGGAFVLAGILAGIAWKLMADDDKREAQREAQAFRFPFPRIHGPARFSNDEDLRKGGLI